MSVILLLGRSGQIGGELESRLGALGTLVVPDRQEADFRKPASVGALVARVRPMVIVNAAAYTAVDRAEGEEAAAALVNAVTPGEIATQARATGAWLVHYSTDYVFDGMSGPYGEDDEPRPLSAYGRTKLAGEDAIRRSGCRHLILRTSWVYGARGTNFMRTILRLATEREELRVVDDQIGAPTWARHVAIATVAVLPQLLRDEAGGVSGTYHITNAGETSWFRFASLIVEETAHTRDASPRMIPIRSSEYPTPARRPRDSRLDCGKLARTFGVRLPPWPDAARECLAELVA